MKTYSREYYSNRYERTNHSAKTILSLLLERIPPVRSAVDVGCGVGVWLSVLKEKGVGEIQGLDGSWVNPELLAIPRACFKQVDLANVPIPLSRRYDLAICLEVAEHLPPGRAREFVSWLTKLSDHVLFSAAIPLQGGRHHLNEQWQHYWVRLFSAMGYEVQDFIRQKIWNDKRIPYWYRQNILLFCSERTVGGVSAVTSGAEDEIMPLDLVHPELYLRKVRSQTETMSSFRLFCRSLKVYLATKLGKAGKPDGID